MKTSKIITLKNKNNSNQNKIIFDIYTFFAAETQTDHSSKRNFFDKTSERNLVDKSSERNFFDKSEKVFKSRLLISKAGLLDVVVVNPAEKYFQKVSDFFYLNFLDILGIVCWISSVILVVIRVLFDIFR